MSTIQQAREAIDAKLDKWEAEISAIQAQLELSKSEVIERVEKQKAHFEQAAQDLKNNIDSAGDYADEAKTKVRASFEQLQVQLALGAADSRDAYQEWKEKIQSAIAAFEADLDRAGANVETSAQTKLDSWKNAYIKEADVFEAEIEAMQAKFNEEKAQAKADFEKYKQEVQSKISDYKDEIGEKRKVAADKLGTFETELSAGATQIKNAVSKLFS